MDSEKYLITGAGGQLGHALQKELGGPEGFALSRTREALDITDREALEAWIPSTRPDAIVNCAAYTDVNGAEVDREACWAVNVQGTLNLAEIALKQDIPFFHISSDFVFGADRGRLQPDSPVDESHPDYVSLDVLRQQLEYSEAALVGPCGYYAGTKAAAEHALLHLAAENPRFEYYIIRTAGLFEKPWRTQRNFLHAITDRINRSNGDVPVVNDVYTNLCSAEDLAQVIVWMLKNREEWGSDGPTCPKGIYHVTNEGVVTWYEVARYVARKIGHAGRVVPTSRHDYAASQDQDPDSAPSYTALSGAKYRSLSGPPMPAWQKAVDVWIDESATYFAK